MEIGWHRGFFFTNTIAKFDSVFKFIRSRFKSIYESSANDKRKTFGKHFYFEVRDNQESRILGFHRLGIANNMSAKEIKQLSLYEYHLLLEDYNQQMKQRKKQSKKA